MKYLLSKRELEQIVEISAQYQKAHDYQVAERLLIVDSKEDLKSNSIILLDKLAETDASGLHDFSIDDILEELESNNS